jgi:hypothetical protein
LEDSAQVYYTSAGPSAKAFAANPTWVKAKDDPQAAADLVVGATKALNANFFMGGPSGSRFNWVGGWDPTQPVTPAVTPPVAASPVAEDPPELTLL